MYWDNGDAPQKAKDMGVYPYFDPYRIRDVMLWDTVVSNRWKACIDVLDRIVI